MPKKHVPRSRVRLAAVALCLVFLVVPAHGADADPVETVIDAAVETVGEWVDAAVETLSDWVTDDDEGDAPTNDMGFDIEPNG